MSNKNDFTVQSYHCLRGSPTSLFTFSLHLVSGKRSKEAGANR